MVDDQSHFEHNREAYRRSIDKFANLVAREVIGGRGLFGVLLDVFQYDQSLISRLIVAMNDKTYCEVYRELETYPLSEYGWSILPVTRRQFVRPDLSKEESIDISRMRSQDDRAGIEYLRALIPHGVNRMKGVVGSPNTAT